MMRGEGSDDVESQFEEEDAIGKSSGWRLSKRVAIGVASITAIILIIAVPVAVTMGNSSSAASAATEDAGDMNVGTTAAPVDVVAEKPVDIIAPEDEAPPGAVTTEKEEDDASETSTSTWPIQVEEASTPEAVVPTPSPTPSPTATPRTLAPVSTETACSFANITEDTTSWAEITDRIIGESAHDLSGFNIAMSADGKILAISAAMNSDKGPRVGHVRVFRFDAGEYSQMGADLDGEDDFDWFGSSLALDASGLRLAVGGRWNDGQHGNDTGHVRLFDFSESSGRWEQVGHDLEGEASGDQFGRSVALSADGTRLAVGASHTDATVNITDVGHVYVYDISEDETFLPIGGFQGDTKDDFSGGSVALSEDGSHVAIAAFLHDAPNGIPDVGQVKIYRYNSGSKWSKVGSNIEGKAAGTQAGLTVALSSDGSRVAVSYPQFIMGIPSPGITRVYELQGGVWEKMGGNDLIGGNSVSMSRNGRVAVGDHLGFKEGMNSGFVHVYQFNEEDRAWDLVGQVINGVRGELSGTSVALSADGLRVAVSSPRASPEGVEDVGAVHIYDLCG